MPWDLEETPLQIKTDSTAGSGDEISAKWYMDDSFTSIGNVLIRFSEVIDINRPNQEILVPDWLITSHVT